MNSKGERKVSILPTLVFQRRTERLDWRRIASLDVDKIIQDGDPNPLEEFINPILYCKADSEFDHDSTDPGFIKVFRLSQLVGEYLQFGQQKDKDKLQTCETKCTELEEERRKLSEEVGNLRESLCGAKKELRRRKEMLASTQNEVLGQNNLDEYDQCPYCVKKFLNNFYLHAHIQRRHQGLPLCPGYLSTPLTSTTTASLAAALGPLNLASFSPKIGNPTVYAFTMSPNGNVGGENVNVNLHGTNLHHRRRDSSTQTLITRNENEEESRIVSTSPHPPPSARSISGKSDGEFGGNDQNGNNISLDHKEKNTRGQTALECDEATELELKTSSEVVTVIKSPNSWNQKERGRGGAHERNTNEKDQEDHDFFGFSSSDMNTMGKIDSSLKVNNPSSSPTTLLPGPRMDIKTICELIENYLEQKSVASQNQHYDKILSSIQQSRERLAEGRKDYDEQDEDDLLKGSEEAVKEKREIETLKLKNQNSSVYLTEQIGGESMGILSKNLRTIPTTDETRGQINRCDILLSKTEDVERNVMRMKDEFETQWKHLSDRVRDSGIEQLKGTLLTEIKKVQDIILNSPKGPCFNGNNQFQFQKSGSTQDKDGTQEDGEVRDKLPLENSLKIIMEVDERFQKQDIQLEELKSNLQTKMDKELAELKTKLEAQEAFWREKLETVDSMHDKEAAARDSKIQQVENRQSSNGKEDVNANPMKVMETMDDQFPSPNSTVEKASIGMQIGNLINPDEPERTRSVTINQSTSMTELECTKNSQIDIKKKTQIQHQQQIEGKEHSSLSIPVAKPRKTKSNLEIVNAAGGCGESYSSEIIQENPIEMRDDRQNESQSQVSKGINQVTQMQKDGKDSDTDVEQEYLTIIHSEGNQTAYSNKNELLPSREKALMGNQTRIHKLQKLLDDSNLEQVSDYTISGGESSESEDSTEPNSLDEKSKSFGDSNRGWSNEPEEISIKPLSNKNDGNSKIKYVFDEEKGRIIEACGKTQMDLVREKTEQELDEQMEGLGINPEASTIGLEEMARALKYLKVTRRSTDEDSMLFEKEREALKKEVNYEVAKRSIHQKLEKYGALSSSNSNSNQIGASPLAKMLNKVKKSGTSWKKKVASAMKRKHGSPTKLQAAAAVKSDTELKTSFFSKSNWVKKKGKESKDQDELAKKKNEENSEESEEEEEESSLDIEMPPFLTKSRPLLRRSSDISSGRRKPKNPNPNSSEDEEEDSFEDIPENDKRIKSKYQSIHSPKQPLQGKQEEQQKLNQQNPSQLQLRMINELKGKFGQDKKKDYLSTTTSTRNGSEENLNLNKTKNDSTNLPEGYKVPNFFVNGSPTIVTTSNAITTKRTNNPEGDSKPSQFIQVTSNGWSNDSKSNKSVKALKGDFFEDYKEADDKDMDDDDDRKNLGEGNYQQKITQRNHISSLAIQQNLQYRSGNGRKEMEKVEEEKSELSTASDTDCASSFETDSRHNNKGKKSFARSDGKRMGFRNRKSSCSDSDDGQLENRTIRVSQRKPIKDDDDEQDEEAYVDLNRSSHGLRPNTARASQAYNGGRKNSPTVYTRGHSSDTSIWETEEEESEEESESRDLPKGKSKEYKREDSNRKDLPKLSFNGHNATTTTTTSAYNKGPNKPARKQSPPTNSWDS